MRLEKSCQKPVKMSRESSSVTETVYKKFFYGYIVVLAALLMWIVGWGTRGCFGIFFKPMADELGFTRTLMSGAVSMASILTAILGAVNGRLCDKFGPRKVITMGGAFLGISHLLISRATGIWQVYFFWGLVSAMGFSVLGPALMSTVSRWFVKRRGLMIAIVSAGAGVGGMIFAPATAWLTLTYSWRIGWIIIGAITLTFMLASGLFLKRDPSELGQLPDGAKRIKKSEEQKQSPILNSKGLTLAEAFRTRQFWILSIILLFFGLNRGIIVHIAPHVTDIGFSLTTAGSILAVNSGVSIVGRLLMGQLADLIGSRRSLIIGFILFPVAFLALLIGESVWTLYIWAVLFGLAWGGVAVLRFSTAGELFGISSLGVIMGTVEMFATAGSGITPLLAGWLFDITHSYQLVFLTCIATGVIGFVMSCFLKPVAKKHNLE